MIQHSYTPSSVKIQPRNRVYELKQNLSRDWFDNHPFKTAWFNSMSITFPLGEKFFIDSVRHFIDQIDDRTLLENIRSFCGQEGFYRREHDRYNQALCFQRSYDLAYLERRLTNKIALAKRYHSPLMQLAVTAALEHITAIMAESALRPDSLMSENTDPELKKLWDWHPAKEMEHKSVAFDVYRAVGGTEKMRKRALRRASFVLMVDILVGLVHMLRRDGNMWNLRLWQDGWKFLFFENGVLRRIWPAYKEYFRDGFHPWQRDTRQLLENWKSKQLDSTA